MASEGAPHGIVANVIAPYAKTRPGSGFGGLPWSPELGEWLHPRQVAPLVGWLAHDSCDRTGDCYTVGGGHFALVELVVHEGLVDRTPTIESIAAGRAALLESPTWPVEGGSSRALVRMLDGFTGPGAPA